MRGTYSREYIQTQTDLRLPEYEVEADDGFRLGGLAAVEDGGLRLCPDEATVVGQETIVAGAHLTLGQHFMV